ncbi:alpha/beta hydrolase [Pseudonocardia eucalypti]|uniref:Alpha/beta hydrolase n=1 Tax=Pseudonocardia eucalypti TaxID=648755 RepID=A0ABP9Q6B8_9PSEU|nr:pimeloyl-ACP methyl ester carboxylesterase [Pseudonocardia eucalypti]
MTNAKAPLDAATTSWRHTPTKSLDVGDTTFVYRELGPRSETPLVLLHHFTAVLDDWDPRLVDGLAAHRHVIAFDNRGIGATGGKVPHTVAAMAADASSFIRTLGHEQVDLLGFSLGGAVAQEVTLTNPDLVRRLILTGTGHRGGGGLTRMPLIVGKAYLQAALTRRDPRYFLFFNRNTAGRRAATDYLTRLRERTADRDKPISHQARIAQLKAIREAGLGEPHDLSKITQPTLVANGDNDAMVATSQSRVLAERIPNAQLIIYPDSGHGGVFQHHQRFVPAVLKFLAS